MPEHTDSDRPIWRHPVSRRALLLAGGGALVVTGLRSSTAPLSLFTGAASGPTSSLHMVRPLDMLVLDFDFYNLAPAFDTDPPVLRRVDPLASASIVAHFASQHVMEQTIYDRVDPPIPGAFASKGVGPSRIVFAVPDTVNVLAYSEQGLLQWWQWVMQVVAGPSAPDDLHTDLLLVDWLHLTPDQQATWAHSSEPVTHGGRTELWHTRLSLRDKDGKPQESIGASTPVDNTVPTVRAVYADAPGGNERTLFGALFPAGFNNPPEHIVRLSSDPTVPVHAPVRADLLSLSAAGSTLDLVGQWAPAAGFDLKGWEHHSWLGRDNKVVIEEYAFLFPFGHRAELIAETKRLVDERTGVAYLRQRKFIRITQRVKTYPAPYQPSGGRAFPFTDITITNTALPELPNTVEPLVAGDDRAFWIQDIDALKPDGTYSDVVFAVVATDLSGRRIEFTTPMALMPGSASVNPADPLFLNVHDRFGWYTGVAYPPLDSRRVIDLRGQEVSYAKEEQPGTASFPTVRWYWGVDIPAAGATPQVVDSPVFYPKLLAGEAQVPAVDATIGPGDPVFLVHDKGYLAGGFGSNKALAASGNDPHIFVRVQDSITAIANLASGGSGADSPVSRTVDNSLKSGGIATPNIQVGAISLALGAVSGSQDSIDKVRDSGKIDFKAYFPDLGDTLQQAALFGEILLGHLFEDGDVSSHGFRISKQTDYPKDKDGKVDRSKKPTGQTVMLSFQAQPVSTGPLLVTKDLTGRTLTGFILDCVNRIDYLAADADTSDKATVTVYGVLTNFSLDLSPIIVSFTKFGFEYQVGGKPKFQPEIESVRFKEPLDFINTIQKFISGVFGNSNESGGGGGSGPPGPDKKPKLGFALLEFDLDQIGLGVKLDVPSLPLGLFSLEGISFSAGVILPFNPVSPIPFQRKRALVRARFGFGTSADKFKVTVYGLGGGGHFLIEVSTHGIEVLDASIEIVGNLAVDLFVAAGRLTIEAGIYFHLDNSAGVAVTLRGYVKATGRLSVIGLINITAEFYADLEYVNKDGHAAVTGHAHVTVSIDILFFHTSVSVEFQKTFVGSDTTSARALASAVRTNTFGDLVSRDDWNLYCNSFAG
jgi:hypothetical protein